MHFLDMIDAVEQNNNINSAQWSDWKDSSLYDVYGSLDPDNKAVAHAFLEALIRDNGLNVEIYKKAFDCLEYGQPFSRH